MATAMGIGQGAGTAAALAAAEGATNRQVEVKQVRAMLLAQGQYLLGEEIDDAGDEALKLHRNEGSGSSASHHNPFAVKS
ncbi:hypothetical protein D3C87_2133960 [compost metagenome]